MCSVPILQPPSPVVHVLRLVGEPQLLLKLLRLRHADHKAELAARANRESERGNRTRQHADGEQPESEVRP